MSASRQSGRMAPTAEQDNRVKIPNGTAAVSADGTVYGESQSLGNREGKLFRKGRNLLCYA